MSFWREFLVGRSHVAFLVGLGGALLLIWRVEASAPPAPVGGIADFAKLLDTHDPAQLAPTRVALTPTETEWARTAWRYFERNYHETTGLVNSVDGYPSTTLWDLGSYLMGLCAAEDLGVIDGPTFSSRAQKLLTSLAALPLVDGKLPNKAYHTESLKMVDYGNHETAGGIGWSAIDVARLGVPLNVISWRHPELTPSIKAILARWQLDEAAHDGRLQGAMRDKQNRLVLVQEGRFGYEQYAAKSLFLLGSDVSRALRYDTEIEVVKVDGHPILADRRQPEETGGAHNAIISEPYVLEALEFGLDETSLPLARAVYAVQEEHAKKTHHLVAVSEDNIDHAPYFVYNSVVNAREPWAAFAPDGKDASAHRTMSLKAALGWSYIFADDYAGKLRDAAGALAQADKGFYSGRYDSDGAVNKALTANTNGVVLETLWYHARGPLVAAVRR